MIRKSLAGSLSGYSWFCRHDLKHSSNSTVESESRERNTDSLRRVLSKSNYSINNQQVPPELAESSYSQNFEHPPPPPPPLQKPPFFDVTTTGSPLSAGSNHIALNGYGNHNLENGNVHQRHFIDGQSASPNKLYAGGSNGRKRDFDNRDDSSDESETQGRRQVDDVTPKLKRRQPKVAEAYR